MRRRIDVGGLYSEARDQLQAGDPAIAWPPANPFTLDHLLQADIPTLQNRLPPP
jgi:hypothetical protein